MGPVNDRFICFKEDYPDVISILKALAFPITCPFYCYKLLSCAYLCGTGSRSQGVGRVRGARTRIRFRQRENELQNRKRDLSVDGKRKSKVKEQAQSFFFTTLPLELRMMIYEMVLCETGTVHVSASQKHLTSALYLRSQTCLKPQSKDPCYGDCGKVEVCTTFNLLLSCRKIYREAINILYSGNTLIFPDPQAFMFFSKLILPKRMNSLKEITIQHDFVRPRNIDIPFGYGDENRNVSILSVIPQLEHLRTVTIIFKDTVWGDDDQLHTNCVRVAEDVAGVVGGLKWKSPRFYLYFDVELQADGNRELCNSRGLQQLFGRWPLGEFILLSTSEGTD